MAQALQPLLHSSAVSYNLLRAGTRDDSAIPYCMYFGLLINFDHIAHLSTPRSPATHACQVLSSARGALPPQPHVKAKVLLQQIRGSPLSRGQHVGLAAAIRLTTASIESVARGWRGHCRNPRERIPAHNNEYSHEVKQ